MIDAHCHIDRYANPLEIISEASRRNVHIVAVTNLPSHFSQGLEHVRATKNVRLALGLHPLLVEQHATQLCLFSEFLGSTSFVGEVGLDFTHRGLPTKQTQLRVFRSVLEQVAQNPKILSIHSRRAEAEVLQLLRQYGIKGVILHWYSGPERFQKLAAAAGYFFSVNPAMTKSRAGRRIIERIPRDRILTETDGPYCRFGNRAARPWDVVAVEEYLSDLWGVTAKTVSSQLTSNFRRLLAFVGCDWAISEFHRYPTWPNTNQTTDRTGRNNM